MEQDKPIDGELATKEIRFIQAYMSEGYKNLGDLWLGIFEPGSKMAPSTAYRRARDLLDDIRVVRFMEEVQQDMRRRVNISLEQYTAMWLEQLRLARDAEDCKAGNQALQNLGGPLGFNKTTIEVAPANMDVNEQIEAFALLLHNQPQMRRRLDDAMARLSLEVVAEVTE